jgi:enoyl-CoA hydratase/carnithine racemase
MATPASPGSRPAAHRRVLARNLRKPADQAGRRGRCADLRDLFDRRDADPSVQVVVFDSANPDFHMAHIDLVRHGEVSGEPGPTGLTRHATRPGGTVGDANTAPGPAPGAVGGHSPGRMVLG